MSLSTKILVGLVLGVVVGLFLGESAAPLQVIGDVYLRLMQMSVTPYIMLALVYGIGRLNVDEAKRVASRGAVLVLILWGVGMLMIIAMPLSFPARISSSYYSGPTEVPDSSISAFLDLFIPSNIFGSLAQNLIPGIILFCVCIGAILMRAENKGPILGFLKTGIEVVENLATATANLTPIGVFAMVGATAGTMTWTEISRLQVFVLGYIVMSLFMIGWVLPLMVRAFLPVGHLSLLKHFREPLLISFTTGSTFVALPLIAEKSRTLLESLVPAEEPDREDKLKVQGSFVDVILPIVYAFPTLGGIIDLFFLQFTGWSFGSELSGGATAKLCALGVPALFSDMAAIPYLLGELRLPLDAYNLYVMAGVIVFYFACALGVMCLVVTVLLSVGSATKRLKLRKLQLIWATVGSVVLGVALMLGLRALLTVTTAEDATPLPAIMTLAIEEPRPAVVHTAAAAAALPAPVAPPSGELLRDVLQRRVVRVGYSAEAMPWSYVNGRGELVGYNIELAHRLAADLSCDLEFVPIDFSRWADELDARRYDIAMLAYSISPERIDRVDFTEGVRSLPAVFVTRDHRKDAFASRASIRKMKGVRLAVLDGTRRFTQAGKEFPDATIVPLARAEDFFAAGAPVADAWYTEAGKGYAYALLYPAFDAVNDSAGPSVAEAYPIPKGERAWQTYLDAFLRTQRDNGTEQFLYEKYVLGKHPPVDEPRWSIMRDVLGW